MRENKQKHHQLQSAQVGTQAGRQQGLTLDCAPLEIPNSLSLPNKTRILGASERAQLVKARTTIPEDLSLTLRIHMGRKAAPAPAFAWPLHASHCMHNIHTCMERPICEIIIKILKWNFEYLLSEQKACASRQIKHFKMVCETLIMQLQRHKEALRPGHGPWAQERVEIVSYHPNLGMFTKESGNITCQKTHKTRSIFQNYISLFLNDLNLAKNKSFVLIVSKWGMPLLALSPQKVC